MRRRLLAAVIVLACASPALAETLLTPFAGGAFGGSTDRTRAIYGMSLDFLGGLSGFELEFSFAPSFFGGPEVARVFTRNNVVTLMGSFMLSTPGPLRIYGAAGIGLLKTRLEDPARLFDVDSTDFGVNVGGGVIVRLGEHVGVRADLRYFRALSDVSPERLPDVDLGALRYWRGAGGLALRF